MILFPPFPAPKIQKGVCAKNNVKFYRFISHLVRFWSKTMSKILKKMDVFWIHQHSTSAASLRIYISLNKCYYVLALSMNIVSGSRLSRDGYHFESVKNGYSISKDCISMFMHLIDLDCNETHINSVDAKKCKLSDDNTMFMWHCYLGHVGIKRMKKLHNDSLLGSLDFYSFNTCKPCLMGKMTRTPFTGFVE
jgi:hypothetical protein